MTGKSMQLLLVVIFGFIVGAVLLPAPAAGVTVVQSATGSGQSSSRATPASPPRCAHSPSRPPSRATAP